MLFPAAFDSWTNLIASSPAKIAIGVFTPRHQRQEVYSVNAPPKIKPIAAPPPEIAPITPNALARSFGTVKVTEIIARAAGASRAAKTPCNARAANNIPWFAATPPRADAAAKPIKPIKKTLRRPT